MPYRALVPACRGLRTPIQCDCGGQLRQPAGSRPKGRSVCRPLRLSLLATVLIGVLRGSLRPAIALCAVLCAAGQAHAAPALGQTLVLNVDRDGKQEAAWAAAVTMHLGHSGESPVASPHVTAKDRECKGPQCLDAIAAREHARYILTLSVQTNAPGSFVVTGTLYDAEQHLPYQLPRPAICDCSPLELINRLGEAADELFKEYRRRSRASETEGSSPSAPGGESPRDTQAPGSERAAAPGTGVPSGVFSQAPKRKLVAGVLGGVAVGTLAAAIGLTTLDGAVTTPPCGSSRAMPQCLWDTRAPYGVLYGATAALAIGVGIALFLPAGSEKAKVNNPAPATAASRVEY